MQIINCMETFVAVILSFQGFLFCVEMHWLKFVKAKFAEETAASWRYWPFFRDLRNLGGNWANLCDQFGKYSILIGFDYVSSVQSVAS